MDNRYYDAVIAEMSPFFEENGLKGDNGVFANDTKALKIEYDEARQVYNLLCADVTDGTAGEFSAISSFLFDDSQTEKDAASVGIDFIDSAKKVLGVKTKRKSISGEADLPSASSETVTVSVLVAKLLAVYPHLKDVYRDETAAKGKFLYLDFCTTYFLPEIRNTLDSGNKKAVKKLLDMLADIFVTGDKASSTLVTALLAAAVGKDEKRFALISEKLEDCPHLVTAVNNEILLLVKNKKFARAMKFND